MDRQEFLTRIDKQFDCWEQHESAAWTGRGGQRVGEPSFDHECRVEKAQLPMLRFVDDVPGWPWWKWKAIVRSDGVRYRVTGHAESMDVGKLVCKQAVRTIALGILAQFEERQ